MHLIIKTKKKMLSKNVARISKLKTEIRLTVHELLDLIIHVNHVTHEP